MSNIAGKAYAMNVLTPMKPWRTWINRAIFFGIRLVPPSLSMLQRLKFIHFARWVIIKRNAWPDPRALSPDTPRDRLPPAHYVKNDYMLFCSNFNGTWHQYIDAFSDGIPDGLDLFWYCSTKYPQSIPNTPFKNYINHNQVYTDYYYNATPGSAQRDIKASQTVFEAVKRLEGLHGSSTPEQFAKHYRKALVEVQNCFAAPGYAPVASNDTAEADMNLHSWFELETQSDNHSDAVGLRLKLEKEGRAAQPGMPPMAS